MGDLLIRGMEMPKDGTYNIVHIYSDGHVSMPFWGKGMQIVQGINAVPVPPHGRCIDADALTISTAVPLDGKPYQYVHIDNIKAVPTIIPASE